MNAPHFDHIDTAFLQLSFAIKLWHFLDEHPIEKDSFDVALTIEGSGSRVCLARNEFNTYQVLAQSLRHEEAIGRNHGVGRSSMHIPNHSDGVDEDQVFSVQLR